MSNMEALLREIGELGAVIVKHEQADDLDTCWALSCYRELLARRLVLLLMMVYPPSGRRGWEE